MAVQGQEALSDLLNMTGGFAGPNLEFLTKLPASVKRRVCALKKLQLQSIKIEAQFYERVHALEQEFERLFAPLNEERRKIVSGEKEPSDEDANIPLVHGASDEELKKLEEGSEPDSGAKGIKDFWLAVLKSHDTTGDMIQEHDEPVLAHLKDITTATLDNPPRFSLTFHFDDNEYFTNKTITKEYFLDIQPDEDGPFDYDGPSVARVISDAVQWNDGKNVTKKVVKKKQRRGANIGKFLTKTVRADSFFNFFDPPKSADEVNEDEEAENNDELLSQDYEIGQIIRDSIIPRAVLFFTGEMPADDMFDFGGEDDEDFSDEEEDDE